MMEAETEVMEAATLGAGGLPLRLSSFVSEVSSPYSVGMLPDSRSLDLVRIWVRAGGRVRVSCPTADHWTCTVEEGMDTGADIGGFGWALDAASSSTRGSGL